MSRFLLERFLVDKEFCAAAVQALLFSLLQASVIYVVAMTICLAAGRQRARVRYATLVAALVLIPVCIPVTCWRLLQQRTSVADQAWAAAVNEKIRPIVFSPNKSSELTGESADGSAGEVAAGSVGAVAMGGNRIHAPAISSPTNSPSLKSQGSPDLDDLWTRASPSGLILYAIGVTAMLFGLVRSIKGGRVLATQSSPLSNARLLNALARASKGMGFNYTPAVATCSTLNVAAVVGVLRPIVLLPLAMATEMRPEQIELVIMHELAHIRRHDQIVDFLQRVIEAFLFFNPVVWLLSVQIRAEREWCCDDLVVRVSGSRDAYAESLLRAGEIELQSRTKRWAAGAVLAITGPNSEIRQRMLRLLRRPEQPRIRMTRGTAAITAMLLMFAAVAPVLAAVRVVPSNMIPPLSEQSLPSASLFFATPTAATALESLSRLHRAVTHGSFQEVKMLLSKNADPNIRDIRGWAPLHYAVHLGRADVAELLIRFGADVNCANRNGHTPLHVALGAASPMPPGSPIPQLSMVRLLLNDKADPKRPDNAGNAPIHIAVTSSVGLVVVRDLIAAGAGVDTAGPEGKTALHIACARRNSRMISTLLDAGARANLMDGRGWSALDNLGLVWEDWDPDPKTSPPEIALDLQQYGSSISLAAAAALGFTAIIEAALDKDPSTVNRTPNPTRGDFSLLHWAAASGDAKLVAVLIARGADVNARSADGRTPLHIALANGQKSYDIVKSLILARADVNAEDHRGRRPLHLAVSLHDASIVKLLIAEGADQTAKNKLGYRPLDVLVDTRKPQPAAEIAIAKILLAQNPDLTILGPDGRAPLHSAVAGNRLELVELLLTAGADPNLPDSQARTPLALAASLPSQNSALVEILLKHGANATHK